MQDLRNFVVYIGERPLHKGREDIMDDHEIVELYWQRNEAALSATVEKYGSYCRQISYNILHNQEDAEECVNDAYLGAWQSIPPQRPNCLAAYLGKLTRNVSLNRLKQYSAQKRGGGQRDLVLSELDDCIPAREDTEQAVEEILLVESINRFLRALPEQKRNLFIRRYWYLDPVTALAEKFGMRESKVTSLLFRLRRGLKTHLQQEGIII